MPAIRDASAQNLKSFSFTIIWINNINSILNAKASRSGKQVRKASSSVPPCSKPTAKPSEPPPFCKLSSWDCPPAAKSTNWAASPPSNSGPPSKIATKASTSSASSKRAISHHLASLSALSRSLICFKTARRICSWISMRARMLKFNIRSLSQSLKMLYPWRSNSLCSRSGLRSRWKQTRLKKRLQAIGKRLQTASAEEDRLCSTFLK